MNERIEEVKIIEKVEIIGLHDRFDIKQEFGSDINIIYGENGQFKTTLLHVLTNILNEDYERFLSLKFNRILVYMKNGLLVSLKWRSPARDKLIVSRSDKRANIAEIARSTDVFCAGKNIRPKVAYFPTFRSILEAWFSYSIENELPNQSSIQSNKQDANSFIRKIFGDFTPRINYLSLPEILNKINAKLLDVSSLMMRKDQDLMLQIVSNVSDILISGNQDFIGIGTGSHIDPELMFDELDSIVETIRAYPINNFLCLPKAIDEKVQAIKLVYESLDERAKVLIFEVVNLYKKNLESELSFLREAFNEFTSYINSLNGFLKNKEIVISSKSDSYFEPFIKLNFGYSETPEKDRQTDGSDLEDSKDENIFSFKQEEDISSLSSGERQIATLLYAVYISSQEIVLIDEPEISLHVAWQRKLLQELSGAMKNKQVIVCTHSPMIGSNFTENIMKMNISLTNYDEWSYDPEILTFDDYEDSDKEEISQGEESETSEDELEGYEDKKYYEHEED